MKKTKGLFALASLFVAAAMIFSGCSMGSSDDSSSTPKTEKSTVPTIASVTKDVSELAAESSLNLENYAYKVIFNTPISNGEKWNATLSFDVADLDDNDEVYELGYLSATSGGLTEAGGGKKSVTLYVEQNKSGSGHSATLVISYGTTGTETSKTITLNQKAASSNGSEDSVAMKQFIGYGYNVRKGYASTICRSDAPIFKVSAMMSEDGLKWDDDEDAVKIVYADESTGLTYREASGSNIAELESSLKITVNGDFDIAGFSAEIEDAHTEWTHKSDSNYQYAWADIKANKLTAVINTDNDTLAQKALMTTNAYKAINGINKKYKTGDAGFKELVSQYGTHVVKGGILGGKVHIGMQADTSNITGTFEAGGMIKAGYDGLFKLETQVDGSYKKTLTENKSSFSFSSTVRGGSSDSKESFSELLTERDFKDNKLSGKFSEWQGTLSDGNNCVLVDFVSPNNLVPLYDLLDPELDDYETRYAEMYKYFNEGQLEKDFPVTEQSSYVSTLPQKIDTSKISFSNNWSGSLVKDIYNDGTLLARLCNEYIPEIDMSKRVNVLYPAKNGKVFWNRGLYAGDKIHKPHTVGWNNGKVVLTEKADLNYTQYTTFYLTGTTLSTYEPTYFSTEQQDKIEATSANITNQDYVASIGGGKYNMVKIEANLYTRDFFNNAVYGDGTPMANVDGSTATPVVNKYNYESDKYYDLPSEYQNVHYYPIQLFTQKWTSHGGFVNNDVYTLPTTSAITGLVSRLSVLSKIPDANVAAMFMEGGVLGLNLKKSGFIGFNTSKGSSERYYFEQGRNCILGCWDDSDGTTDPAKMRSNAWNNLTKISISPDSGGVSRTDYTNMKHEYKAGLIWYARETADELRSEKAPCYRLIICQPCK